MPKFLNVASDDLFVVPAFDVLFDVFLEGLLVDELELLFKLPFELDELSVTFIAIGFDPVISFSDPSEAPTFSASTIISVVPALFAINVIFELPFSTQTDEELTDTILLFFDEILNLPPHLVAVIVSVAVLPFFY